MFAYKVLSNRRLATLYINQVALAQKKIDDRSISKKKTKKLFLNDMRSTGTIFLIYWSLVIDILGSPDLCWLSWELTS